MPKEKRKKKRLHFPNWLGWANKWSKRRQWPQVQCDRIALFCKGLGDDFSAKVAQIFHTFWGYPYCKNVTFWIKAVVVLSEKIGLLCIPTSGHTESTREAQRRKLTDQGNALSRNPDCLNKLNRPFWSGIYTLVDRMSPLSKMPRKIFAFQNTLF